MNHPLLRRKRALVALIIVTAFFGCHQNSSSSNSSHLSFESCPDQVSAAPTTPTSVVAFDKSQAYEIGYTTYQTNIPGSRWANDITQRSMVYSTATDSVRAIATALTSDLDTSSSLLGWSPDGSMAIVEYNWSDPSNAKWEQEHGSFHMDGSFFKADDYLVHVDEADRLENITAQDSISFFNSAAFFYPNDMTKIGFTSYVNNSIQPYVMNRDGTNKTPLLNDKTSTYGLSISPNHKRIAYNSDYQLYIANPDGSERRLVDTGFSFNFIPQWSPDSRYILFIGNPEAERSLFLFDTMDWKLRLLAKRGGYSGSASVYDVTDFRDGSSDVPTWSPDGKWIYFTRLAGDSVEMFRVSGPSNDKQCVLEQLTKSASKNWHAFPTVSPDGKYLAYASFPAGVRQIAALNLTTFNESIFTKYNNGYAGMWPHWRPPLIKK